MPDTVRWDATDAADPQRDELARRLLASLIAQASELPIRNAAVLARVARLCDDESATPTNVAHEAARDESFLALLLRMANSAQSASATRVGDAQQAVVRLGLTTVRGLAMATMASPALGHKYADEKLASAATEQHRHAIRVGLIAEYLAPEGVSGDLALSAGVLHNLGLSVLARFAPEPCLELLARAAHGQQLRENELAVLGFGHAELGASLAESWSYPPELVTAIREHDNPEPPSRLAAIVQVADLLVRTAGIGIEAIAPIPPAVEQLAGIDLRGILRHLDPIFDVQDMLEAKLRSQD